jgi:hypothetical protein
MALRDIVAVGKAHRAEMFVGMHDAYDELSTTIKQVGRGGFGRPNTLQVSATTDPILFPPS